MRFVNLKPTCSFGGIVSISKSWCHPPRFVTACCCSCAGSTVSRSWPSGCYLKWRRLESNPTPSPTATTTRWVLSILNYKCAYCNTRCKRDGVYVRHARQYWRALGHPPPEEATFYGESWGTWSWGCCSSSRLVENHRDCKETLSCQVLTGPAHRWTHSSSHTSWGLIKFTGNRLKVEHPS